MANTKRKQRRQLRQKARERNQWRLCRKWNARLAKYAGPGEVILLYNSQFDVGASPETFGEAVTDVAIEDAEDRTWGFTLYEDETIGFDNGPDSCYGDDTVPPRDSPKRNPMRLPDGPPPAVITAIDILDVEPRWNDACDDRTHRFEIVETAHVDPIRCTECEHSTRVLGFLGHSIPEHRTDD